MEESEGVRDLEEWATGQKWLEGHRFFRSSGSSGVEKWIALSNEALEWSARAVIAALEMNSDDVLGLALPEIHVGGYGMVVRATIAGARLERFDERWEAIRFARWCRSKAVSISSLVPTQVHDLVRAGATGSESLRVIVVGGGALDDQLKERARALGWPVLPSYGMTETSSQVATGDGLPLLPGWEAKLVEGRLALRGGGLLTAVIRRKDDRFVAKDPKVDGWFVTNDRAECQDGRLRILGRADRRVKVLGELVDLDGVERFWGEELQREVAVVTVPDERRGVRLHLFYEGPEEDLGSSNEARPGLERLSGWTAVEQLPRSALGKIDRASLPEIHAE